MKNKVSVIICTAYRFETISRCLDSLAGQSNKNFEVIIVDGRSDSKLKSLIRKFSNKFPLRHVKINQQNLPYARNVGILHARHKLVAFIDDDALADEHWIHNILVFFLDHSYVSILGGKVVAYDYNYLSKFSEKIFYFGDHTNEQRVVLGVNMTLNLLSIFKLSKTLRSPLFKNELTTAGDDTELCFYIQSLGGTIIYHPYVCVRHLYRSSLAQLFKRTIQYAYGDTIVKLNPAYPRLNFMTQYKPILATKINLFMRIFASIHITTLNTYAFMRKYGLIWFPLIILREIAYSYGVFLAVRNETHAKQNIDTIL